MQNPLGRSGGMKINMAENIVADQPVVPSKAVSEDLSRELEQSMQRKPDERIKAVRVFADYYRCNLWTPDKSTSSFWLATGTIRESKFLRVTRTSAGLLIEDMNPIAGGNSSRE